MSPALFYRDRILCSPRDRERASFCVHMHSWLSSFLVTGLHKGNRISSSMIVHFENCNTSDSFLAQDRRLDIPFPSLNERMILSPWFLVSTIMRPWIFALGSEGKREAGKLARQGVSLSTGIWLEPHTWHYVDCPGMASYGPYHTP